MAFSNFHRSRKQGKLFEEIFQNFVKTALCGVVGSERTFKRVWDSSQQAKSVRQAIGANGQIYGKGYPFPMIANMGKEGKHISMETLARICETLDCGIMDVIELASDEPSATGGNDNGKTERKNHRERH